MGQGEMKASYGAVPNHVYLMKTGAGDPLAQVGSTSPDTGVD